MAARFDAATDGAQYTGTLFNSSPWTACWWMFHLVGTTSHTPVLIRTGSTDGSVNRGPWTDGNNAYRVEVSGLSSSYGAAIAQDTWHHWTFIANGSDNQLILDRNFNQPYAQLTQAPASDTGSPIFLIGGDTASAQNNARCEDLRIWEAVLTKAQIDIEAVCRKAQRTANLWGDYPMKPGSGRLDDISGNARHLSAVGTLTDEDGTGLPDDPSKFAALRKQSFRRQLNFRGSKGAFLR